MLSTSAGIGQDTSFEIVEKKPTAATVPPFEEKQAQSTGDGISGMTANMGDRPNKDAPSKTDRVKGWAKSARQWTIFGGSTNSKQERYAFYR